MSTPVRFCDQCGSPIAPGDGLCASCGDEPPPTSVGRRVALATAGAVTSAVAVLGLFLSWIEEDFGGDGNNQ